MKLHLPKLLAVAILGAMTSTYAHAADAEALASSSSTIWEISPYLPSTESNWITVEDKTLTDGKLGLVDGQGNFLTLGTIEYKAINLGNYGYFKLNGTPGNVTKNYNVTGTLTVSGSAEVQLGGQVKTKVEVGIGGSDEFTGLIANNMIVNGEAKVSTWNAIINNLTVAGNAKVEIHTQRGEGNMGLRLEGPVDSKQVQIKNILNVNGGSLTIGNAGYINNTDDKDASKNPETEFHTITSFGSFSYEGNPTIVGSSITGVSSYEIKESQINQTAGVLTVAGKSLSIGGLNIDQQGGSMVISKDTYHFLSDYGDSTITQKDGTMTIGCIKAFNTYYDSVVTSLKENGQTAEINPSISITQTGSGTMNLNGVQFANQKTGADSTEISSITQTGNGTINLNGQYVGTKFDIKQQGTTVGDKTATINVAKGAEITVNSMTLEGGVFINNGTVNGPMASQVATLAEEGDISTTTDAEATFITIAGGEYKNFGTTNADILVDGGTLTLENGSSVGNIEMKSGSILVTNDKQTATVGSITLSGGSITFEADAQLTLQTGSVVKLGEGVEVIVQMSADALAALEAGSNVTLFDAGTNTVEFNNTLITFKDDQNNEVKATVTGNTTGGNVTVNAVVPEPTTATLSLLALAALASRRRRK